MIENTSLGQIEFHSLYPGTKAPARMSRTLGGSMQARAARLCSPFTEASGFGWYLYPPVDFAVRLGADSSEWTLLDGNEPVEWRSLSGGRTGRLPHSGDVIEDARRASVTGLDVFDKYGGLPFIEADPRNPHMLEVIPGLIAKTPPGWYLLLRGLPNENRPESYQVLEGVIECDWYRAYLPVMINILRRDTVIRFHAHRPIMAAQPVTAEALDFAGTEPAFTAGIDAMPSETWEEFVSWRRLKQDPDSAARYISHQKRRRREVHRSND